MLALAERSDNGRAAEDVARTDFGVNDGLVQVIDNLLDGRDSPVPKMITSVSTIEAIAPAPMAGRCLTRRFGHVVLTRGIVKLKMFAGRWRGRRQAKLTS